MYTEEKRRQEKYTQNCSQAFTLPADGDFDFLGGISAISECSIINTLLL